VLKFTEEHEWLKVDGDTATVGITEFASAQLGDLVFIELPRVGTKLKKGDAAAVRSPCIVLMIGIERIGVGDKRKLDHARVDWDPRRGGLRCGVEESGRACSLTSRRGTASAVGFAH